VNPHLSMTTAAGTVLGRVLINAHATSAFDRLSRQT